MIEKYVRLAKEEDIERLLELSKEFHKASPYRHLGFDTNKGKSFLIEAIRGMGYNTIVLVATKDTEVIGFIVGAATEPVFSSSKVSMELGWWVTPKHRNTRASFLLFKAYEDWALRAGCSYVQAAFLPGVSNDLDEFYKKQGYIQVESSYMKRIKI